MLTNSLATFATATAWDGALLLFVLVSLFLLAGAMAADDHKRRKAAHRKFYETHPSQRQGTDIDRLIIKHLRGN